MDPDDDICYCHHVSLRKLVNFARREQPRHPSQMSECLGAGTGCGWCIPYLAAIAERRPEVGDPLFAQSREEYAARRQSYIVTRAPRRQFESAPAPASIPPTAPASDDPAPGADS